MNSRLSELLTLLSGVRRTSDTQWEAICPAHDDDKPSLCIATLNTGLILMKCQAGCDTKDVLSEVGLTMHDLFPPEEKPAKSAATKLPAPNAKIVATYDYRDTDGTLLFQAVRFEPKDFRQRQAGRQGRMDVVRKRREAGAVSAA